jgi:hypothetical protein
VKFAVCCGPMQITFFVWFLYIIVTVTVVVTHIMAIVPTLEFQKLWSNLTESLRLKYENNIQHPYANAVMESVCKVLTTIACLEGCAPSSVSESLKWILIVQNMVDTRRNLQQFLKWKQLYSTMYRVYTEVLHDLTAVLKRECLQRGNSQDHNYCVSVHRGIAWAKMIKVDTYRWSLQQPPQESSTPNCSWSLKFQPGTSSLHWGRLKWRLTMEMTQMTPPSVSNVKCLPTRQIGYLPLY